MNSTKKKSIYPLKFIPSYKEKVWGGENWIISGFCEDSSVIAEGFLADNNLYDVIETYMGEIVGEDHYKLFGNEFPLLIKELNIQERLSLQVHPDDETAFDLHNSYGKSEAWYILDAEPGAKIYMGFNRDIDPNEFYRRAKEGTLEEVLNVVTPHKGDFFYIEAGIVHSAGGGIRVAEIQQLSDVTYRIYDWGREKDPKTAREMHLELAFSCINYSKYDESKYFVKAGTTDHQEKNGTSRSAHLTRNEHFRITYMNLSDTLHVYTDQFKSFILYYCISGGISIRIKQENSDDIYTAKAGEWILVPAGLKDFYLSPEGDKAEYLETYIEVNEEEKDNYINEESGKDKKD